MARGKLVSMLTSIDTPIPRYKHTFKIMFLLIILVNFWNVLNYNSYNPHIIHTAPLTVTIITVQKQPIVLLMVAFADVGHTEASVLNCDCFITSLKSLVACLT